MDFRLDQFAHAWRSVEERRIEFERGDLGGPTQPCLRAFENQKLKELAIIMQRHAPFLIVIGDVWFRRSPRTTRHAANIRDDSHDWNSKLRWPFSSTRRGTNRRADSV